MNAAGEVLPRSNVLTGLGNVRALGLRARADAFSILTQADRRLECLTMFFSSLFRHLNSNSARARKGRSRRQWLPRRALWLEALEDRTVPSTLTVTSAAD